MITDLFFFIISGLIGAISLLLSVLNYVVPTGIQNAIAYAFGTLSYVSAFFPVDTLMQALIAYLGFIELYFVYRLIMFVYTHLPMIGRGSGTHH